MNNDSDPTNDVRAVLQALQDGYTARDPDRLDDVMDLFVTDPALEVIGTGATTAGEGEWCRGREAVRRLIELDWRYWGDLALDVAGARIATRGAVAWVATAGTVRERIERGPAYESYLDYVKEILESDAGAELKMLEMLRTGNSALYELAQGETFIWPLRFTAVLVLDGGRWRFHQMQFSYPTTRYPDVRRTA